ncbi:hydrogenase [Wenzhouxiangella sp. AB-CW3]|uniref:3-hydroxybutyrate oligomer hydrolase family protein n=1 Tax=Wenzhouxiangella sp. AB-CW3 TaxID=2771012 RepID=UPI00168AC180|nr:3-hydroxybutyrate oligomer hydrolase family protein [Wenzhouxiangella sp. AB-CW3]QOC23557.1 hydrogenase [Wenzhouxiangella sp. AB-CW3]
MRKELLLLSAGAVFVLAACEAPEPPPEPVEEAPAEAVAADPSERLQFPFPVRVTEHRDGDDLVSAGLNVADLTGTAPAPADPEAPSAAELRRLAVHANWQGIGTLSPAAGLGGLLDGLPEVPGHEFHAFLTLPDASQPFRVALQLPDSFDADAACLVVSPASGSRGTYGAIAVAAPWAFERGCAVAYTDKAAGTDIFDFSDGTGTDLAGRRVESGEAELGLAFAPLEEPAATVGMRHAHSGDQPEADWGQHVLAAAAFGLDVIDSVLDAELDADSVRVLGFALSNGGNAVLRAAEIDDSGLLDAVVAVSPNITPLGQPALFDYASLAALYQPCLLADADFLDEVPMGQSPMDVMGQARCQSLAEAGLLDEPSPSAARDVLTEAGFDDAALSQSAVNIALDLWRSVLVTYASSYLQRGPFDMPCGFALEAAEATAAQRQAWWGSHSGIAPGNGIEIVDTMADGNDSTFAGLKCLRELVDGNGPESDSLHAALRATQASAVLPDIPVVVVHGRDDGLIPVAFSSRPYVTMARNNGARIAYWEVEQSQHFDALLAVPGFAGEYVPILPYGWQAMDHILAVLDDAAELGEDWHIQPQPPEPGEPLEIEHLGLE